MSTIELEKLTQAWPEISRVVRVPRSEKEYGELVASLDQLAETVGEDEEHPLASLMDVLSVLLERYEDENMPELEE